MISAISAPKVEKTIEDYITFTMPISHHSLYEHFDDIFVSVADKEYKPSFIYFDFTSLAINVSNINNQGTNGSFPYNRNQGTSRTKSYIHFIKQIENILKNNIKPGTVMVWYYPGGNSITKTEFYK